MKAFFSTLLGVTVLAMTGLSGCGSEPKCAGSNQAIVPVRFQGRILAATTPTPTPAASPTSSPMASKSTSSKAPAALTGSGCSVDQGSNANGGCVIDQFGNPCTN